MGTQTYIIRHKASGKVYVGCGDANRRVSQHFSRSQNRHLRNAVKKYGKDSFTVTVTEHGTAERAGQAEAWLVDYFGGPGGALVYNARGGGREAWEPTPEYCALRSEQAFEIWRRPGMKDRRSAIAKRVMNNPKLRRHQSVAAKKAWERPEVKAAHRKYPDEQINLWGELRAAGWKWREIAAVEGLRIYQVQSTFAGRMKSRRAA